MKIFIDTNIWLRYILKDDEDQFKQCRKLIEKIESGSFKPYISTIVLLEIYFILTSTFKIEKRNIQEYIKSILEARNLTLIDKTDFREAWKIHQKTDVKLADCLIASQLPTKTTLISYDKDFKKIKGLQVLLPAEVLN